MVEGAENSIVRTVGFAVFYTTRMHSWRVCFTVFTFSYPRLDQNSFLTSDRHGARCVEVCRGVS